MEAVYKSKEKWYHCKLYISQKNVSLLNKKTIKNSKDVDDIDEYINIVKYVKNVPIDSYISTYIKENSIDDMYIKSIKTSSNSICFKCVKSCKSSIVFNCNCFVGKKIKKV